MKKAVLREYLKNREYKASVFETDKVGVLSMKPSKPKKAKKGDK